MALIPQSQNSVIYPITTFTKADVGYIWVLVNLELPNSAKIGIELWNQKSDKFENDGSLTSNSPIATRQIGTIVCDFNSQNIGDLANQFCINYLQTNFNLNFVVTDLN